MKCKQNYSEVEVHILLVYHVTFIYANVHVFGRRFHTLTH